MKNKMLIRWNTFKINLIARLIGRLNVEVVDQNALWDTAMTTMEKSVGSNVDRLVSIGRSFEILSHRAMERAEDCVIEQRNALQRAVDESANDWPDPHYGTMA